MHAVGVYVGLSLVVWVDGFAMRLGSWAVLGFYGCCAWYACAAFVFCVLCDFMVVASLRVWCELFVYVIDFRLCRWRCLDLRRLRLVVIALNLLVWVDCRCALPGLGCIGLRCCDWLDADCGYVCFVVVVGGGWWLRFCCFGFRLLGL